MMRKLFIPLFALLMLMGCQKDNAADLLLEQEVIMNENASATSRSSKKINLCHNGRIINVSSNALNTFLNKGAEVEFGQLGNYGLSYITNGREFIHEMEITQSDNGSFSGSGRSITTGQEWTVQGTIDSDGNYSFTLDYTNSIYLATATGTFDCDGSGYYGGWSDSNNRGGTWTGTYQSY